MRSQNASTLRRRVAANVRRLRLAQGLTLEVAAERADLNVRHWQKIEAAQMNLTISTLVKLANALGSTPADLVSRPPRR